MYGRIFTHYHHKMDIYSHLAHCLPYDEVLFTVKASLYKLYYETFGYAVPLFS